MCVDTGRKPIDPYTRKIPENNPSVDFTVKIPAIGDEIE
jgi:hypothetical protein